MAQQITIITPDDFHIHLRDGDALKLTVPHAANQFNRVTVMPNLKPAVDQVSDALAYFERIATHVPEGATFDPLMTLYLTEKVTVEEVFKAAKSGIKAIKLYPQGATTNSSQGVSDVDKFDDVFAAMAENNVMLLIHGEVSDQSVDIFHRETTFVEETLTKIISRHPKLRIVLEHITTAHAAQFVEQSTANIAATITPQHLLVNRNHLLSGGIKPHYYCLPILKKESDRTELLRVATSGNPKFFLGTDSAPHATSTKESSCGCAGCYSAPFAIEYYAEAFDSVGKINRLENFSSKFGADFYQLDRNTSTITLEKSSTNINESYNYLGETITPLMAGESLSWKKLS